jgi:hypothetical protein
LKEKVNSKLGVKAFGCFSIIKAYEHSEKTTLELVDALNKELGRVSGDVEVTKKELSEIFGKSIEFISSVTVSLEDPNNTEYKPDYKFSKEILDNLKENAKLEEYSLRNFLHLV